jgi:hexosaminidase
MEFQMSKPSISVIPEPRRIQYREGIFSLPKKTVVQIFSSGKNDLSFLAGEIKKEFKDQGISKIVFKRSENKTSRLGLLIGEEKDSCDLFSPSLETPIGPEGYILDCDPRRIVLVAQDPAGLFYACQTLFQIIRKENKNVSIPAVRIEDAPEMRVRGVQIELSFLTPRLATIKAMLRQFARYKINTVLISYLDKFKFEKHPLAGHPDAFSKNQIRELDALARSLHIDLVPILQCFGHAENVLRHPEYAHLREGQEIHTQFCPEHPGSFRVFQEMAEEILSVHSSPYFHIGADETYYLGHCPKCKKMVEREGKVGLFLSYVNKACDFIVRKGKTPILWDDIFCKSPSDLKKLHKKAVISYWDYFPADPQNPFVFFRGEGYYCDKTFWKNKKWWGGEFVSRSNCRDFQDLEPKTMEHYRSYFTSTGDLNYLRPFPFYKFYQDKGFATVGCPAVRGGEYGYIIPDYARRMSNTLQMIRVVAEHGGLGAINTSWSEIASPEELTIYPLIATAEFSWAHGRLLPETFDQKFIRRFFGSTDPRLIAAMKTIGGKNPPLCFSTGERTDLCDKGGFLPASESLKDLLDIRINNEMSSADLPNTLAEFQGIQACVLEALAFLNQSKQKVKGNQHLYDHLILAARTLLHKIDQFFLFYSIEKKLSSKPTAKDSEAKHLLKRLTELVKNVRQIKNENEKLFFKTYTPSSVKARSAMMFEGEVEKMNEYLKKLKNNFGEKKKCPA